MYKIKKTPQGYIVLYKHYTIFGSKWKPYLNYLGTSEPYPFRSYDSAMEAIILEVKQDTHTNSFK
jgi:hypothetical protein